MRKRGSEGGQEIEKEVNCGGLIGKRLGKEWVCMW